eukprot:48372_1
MSRQLDDEIEHGEPCFSNKIMDEQREKLDENIAILQKKLKNTTITYRDELAQYTTWIIMCLISIIFLFLGILSLMLKITQLSFIHDKALVDYTIWDVISLLGFCNQLWNICDTNKVKLEQIYQFAFSGPRANYTRYMCQNICIFDSVIKNQLCESYGFRGFLIAMCLKPSLLLKIIVKPRYADENNEWIKCMNELNDLHRKISLIDEDENINDIDIVSVLNELQQEEKEVKEQQPSTPFYLSMNKNESKYLNLSAFKRRFQKISIFANCKNCGHKLYDFFFLKSREKPLHPFISTLRINTRLKEKEISTQEYLGSDDKINWALNGIQLFERLQSYITPSIIAFVILISSICSIVFIRIGFGHPIISLLQADGEFTIRNLCGYCFFSSLNIMLMLNTTWMLDGYRLKLPTLTLARQIVSVKTSVYYLVIIIYLFHRTVSLNLPDEYLFIGFIFQFLSYMLLLIILFIIIVVSFDAFLVSLFMSLSFSLYWWMFWTFWSSWSIVGILLSIKYFNEESRAGTCTDNQINLLFYSMIIFSIISTIMVLNRFMLTFKYLVNFRSIFRKSKYARIWGLIKLLQKIVNFWISSIKITSVVYYITNGYVSILMMVTWNNCADVFAQYVYKGIVYYHIIWGMANIAIPWVILFVEREQLQEIKKKTGLHMIVVIGYSMHYWVQIVARLAGYKVISPWLQIINTSRLRSSIVIVFLCITGLVLLFV